MITNSEDFTCLSFWTVRMRYFSGSREVSATRPTGCYQILVRERPHLFNTDMCIVAAHKGYLEIVQILAQRMLCDERVLEAAQNNKQTAVVKWLVGRL